MPNPRNFNQVKTVDLTTSKVDGIVFWTKNPSPMIKKLDKLHEYMFYFQFSVTPYGKDIEPNLPQKNTDILETFKNLSSAIGKNRVIWRYDPILINTKYTANYHIKAFEKIAKSIHMYTETVTISFVDTNYRGPKSNISKLNLINIATNTQIELAENFAKIAHNYGLKINTCAETIDLQSYNIEKSKCIDQGLFSKLLGQHLNIKKDKNQRPECGCAASVDIGMYNTCGNGCLYCYANYNKGAVAGNMKSHDPSMPMIIGGNCD